MSAGEGYPAGTRCMITWCPWDLRLVGDEVTIVDSTLIPWWQVYPRIKPAFARDYMRGLAVQRITGPLDRGGPLKAVWPHSWMRPIDPDELAADQQTTTTEEISCT